jgi:hypothetical protein
LRDGHNAAPRRAQNRDIAARGALSRVRERGPETLPRRGRIWM